MGSQCSDQSQEHTRRLSTLETSLCKTSNCAGPGTLSLESGREHTAQSPYKQGFGGSKIVEMPMINETANMETGRHEVRHICMHVTRACPHMENTINGCKERQSIGRC